jgi:predicted DCC family thiol-disulfide oxidoreductase YuxK
MNDNETHIVLFDGVCNLCNKSVQFIIRNDPKVKFRFAAIQSEIGQLLLKQLDLPLDRFDSIVYISDNKFYIKSTAVLQIIKELGLWWKALYFLIVIPRIIRDMAYNIIANRRYTCFGKSETCMIPPPEYSVRFLE